MDKIKELPINVYSQGGTLDTQKYKSFPGNGAADLVPSK